MAGAGYALDVDVAVVAHHVYLVCLAIVDAAFPGCNSLGDPVADALAIALARTTHTILCHSVRLLDGDSRRIGTPAIQYRS